MSIIVHSGKAHADDFLAACVCSYKLNKPVFRRPFEQSDLLDPNCWVLDQGGKFEPELHNFDHHHINQEICAFTMALDYFYEQDYRTLLPSLRYVEIFDSFGSERAAEFVGAKQENLEIATSPIHTYLLKSFSKVDGLVGEPFSTIMNLIGKEICEQIENNQRLMDVLSTGASFFEYQGIKILDTTKCQVPEGTYDLLPTKAWCKQKNVRPVVILTKDSRVENGYRMVSVNTNNLKFEPNEKSHFTHVSGFLCAFSNYSDYAYILTNYSKR
jgi:hypothetical protein